MRLSYSVVPMRNTGNMTYAMVIQAPCFSSTSMMLEVNRNQKIKKTLEILETIKEGSALPSAKVTNIVLLYYGVVSSTYPLFIDLSSAAANIRHPTLGGAAISESRSR